MQDRITDEDRRMARLLGMNPDRGIEDGEMQTIRRMIELRQSQGEEAFLRECSALFSQPPPTIRDVMRELAEIKRMLAMLTTNPNA